MVEEISSNVVVAPTIQEQVNVNQAKTAESDKSTTTTSGQDTVSISKEAQELLAEEARIEDARTEEALIEEALIEDDHVDAQLEEARADAQTEEERLEALRLENADEDAVREKAEFDRLQKVSDEEPPQVSEEDSEATRA